MFGIGYYFRVINTVTNMPEKEALVEALKSAGTAHHEYEKKALKGVRDEEWAAFYAAYVLGRLGDFVPASDLAKWLSEAPLTDDWTQSAAAHVILQVRNDTTGG